MLFFEGYNHSRGDRVLSAARLLLPDAGMADPRRLEGVFSALKGFRRLARGHTRAPLPKQTVFAAIGLALRARDMEMALALALAWDCYLRLPSDLFSLTGAALVPPARGCSQQGWCLLLYPEELEGRSKIGGFDEGVPLSLAMSAALDKPLRRLKAARGPAQPLLQMTVTDFRNEFKRLFAALGRPSAHPYQVRHGGASYDAAEGTRTLPEIQLRLRHETDSTTRRYAKRVRYIAEVGRTPEAIISFGELVEQNLPRWIACPGAVPALVWLAA